MKVIFKMGEEWRVIKDFSNYAISNYGRIKRNEKGRGTHKGKILKGCKNSRGYLQATLYKDGNRTGVIVHRLVTKAFLGPCPKGKEVNHKDGNKLNPYVGNLEYVTASQNVKHAYKNGLLKGQKGEINGRSILTSYEVEKIRKLYKRKKFNQYELADMFNVSQANISGIVNYKKWHI